ncbi:uncharacterized protein BP5553_03671 [Venustampulla echinocandica]|uniref:25S rRNA (uridine-N(3))-methyltransferase BMT5-like domain-containing protein n=1 Tax=Venustampulla echinocandica TaxID=2656787 RepID=A0A370TUX8_9HELO|nr:uncharacterized protein BP5553_03671 [Venustampulla echinocandica]RDL39331.1 hypothetical protein BP5553_03671 [Venustampulla echinocandica]
MGKNRRLQKSSSSSSKKIKLPTTGKAARPTGVTKAKPKPQSSKKPRIQAHQSSPTIPFQSADKILLVGEGDLSFACSLIAHHGCKDVTATVLEGSEEGLVQKYPEAEENIKTVRSAEGVVRFGVDVGKKGLALGKKDLASRGEGWERVFFNFPHVGGKSKDVNRQVRYNQGRIPPDLVACSFKGASIFVLHCAMLIGISDEIELLVNFFTNIRPLLSPRSGSSIIVTLFEGEPYTLWNIRDLARHSNLEVTRSFRFQAKAYPGYRHARTLGVVKGKNGEIGAGWKGEERDSRTYEFVRKGEGVVPGVGRGKAKGKGGEEESSEESTDDMDVNESWHTGDGEKGSGINEGDETIDNDDEDEDEDGDGED